MKTAALDDLIAHLSRLPSIGERTATRLAFYLLRAKPQFREGLARAIERLQDIVLCSQCRTVTEQNPCAICSSHVRQQKHLCIVEKASDIYSVERLGSYRGKYFVLHGLLNPMEGVGTEDLGLQRLMERFENDRPEEIILALNPTVEGDVTSSYLLRLLTPLQIPISRLAAGLPIGSELEFADQITLGKAFEGRTRLR